MDLELIKEKETPLLERKRVSLTYNSQDGKTPSRKQILKEVAKKVGGNADAIAIRHIYTKFGETAVKIIAHVYKDAKTMQKYENKVLLAKQVEAPKKEEAKEAE